MKKKIILRCWLISLLTAFVVFVASMGTVYGISHRDAKRELVAESEVYTALVEQLGAEFADAFSAVKSWNIRLSVFDLEGNALFESDTNQTLDNHLDRAEIQAALNGNSEIVVRYSDTFRRRMYYYASVTEGTPSYIVRIALPAKSVWRYVGYCAPFVAAALLIALAASYYLARRTGRGVALRMEEVKDSLHSLNEGNYTPIRADMSDEEEFSVLNEINELFGAMQSHYARLEEERKREEFIVDHISQGIVALTAEGRVLFVNRAAKRLFGVDGEGEHYLVYFKDGRICSEIERILETDGEGTFECRAEDRNLVVQLVGPDDPDADKDIAHMILVSDVTREKDAMRQKTEFFANASHELKTPLTSMQGLSELLLAKEYPDEQTRRFLQRIHTESLRLNRIVLDMLYINALETRAEGEERESISLAQVARDELQEYREEIERKNLTVCVDGDAVIEASGRDMRELIGNLVGNAVHYNVPDGFVRVTLQKSEDRILLRVCDGGIGIAPEHLPHLCERFFRVDKSRSKSTGGTGLGLAIVKHVAARYAAKLSFESAPGKGTTVTVAFPADAK